MKPIENVAIVGFGSLGAMYAGCFGAAMGPERVFVVADTARTERYRAEAATFNGEPIRVTYLTSMRLPSAPRRNPSMSSCTP